VLGTAALVVLLNDGQGVFSPGPPLPARVAAAGQSLCAADYDQDGDLDIFVCRYGGSGGQFSVAETLDEVALSFHDSNSGMPNVLLQNDGHGTLTDVTAETGLDQNNRRFSFAAAWEDYDNDGDLDLYVANDFGRNCLYRNDGGRFTDVAAAAGVEDIASGMSVTWGDYNRDGWMDLYVSNMFSAAGNRIAFQRQFKDQDSGQTRSQYQRFARGNTLFENLGGGGTSEFRDASTTAAVTMGRWAWGSLFVDINNDGWQDLLVANGMITNDDSGDL